MHRPLLSWARWLGRGSVCRTLWSCARSWPPGRCLCQHGPGGSTGGPMLPLRACGRLMRAGCMAIQAPHGRGQGVMSQVPRLNGLRTGWNRLIALVLGGDLRHCVRRAATGVRVLRAAPRSCPPHSSPQSFEGLRRAQLVDSGSGRSRTRVSSRRAEADLRAGPRACVCLRLDASRIGEALRLASTRVTTTA